MEVTIPWLVSSYSQFAPNMRPPSPDQKPLPGTHEFLRSSSPLRTRKLPSPREREPDTSRHALLRWSQFHPHPEAGGVAGAASASASMSAGGVRSEEEPPVDPELAKRWQPPPDVGAEGGILWEREAASPALSVS